MAGKVYRLGDRAGAGSKVKIINQLLAGVHIAAAAEAMALGLREGVDADALYEVITHSAGNSWMFENRMAHVLAGDYAPLSAVDIFVKDLGLVLDTARQVSAAAGLHRAPDVHAGVHRRPWPRGRQRGHQDLPGHPPAGGEMSIKLGCIADDFTGATDLANNLCAPACAPCRPSACRAAAARGCRRGGGRAQDAQPARRRGGRAIAGGAGMAQGAEQIYFSTAPPSTARRRAISAR